MSFPTECLESLKKRFFLFFQFIQRNTYHIVLMFGVLSTNIFEKMVGKDVCFIMTINLIAITAVFCVRSCGRTVQTEFKTRWILSRRYIFIFLVCEAATFISLWVHASLFLHTSGAHIQFPDIIIFAMWHVPIISCMAINSIRKETHIEPGFNYSKAIFCISCVIVLIASVVSYCFLYSVPFAGLVLFQMFLEFLFWLCLDAWPENCDEDTSTRKYPNVVRRMASFIYLCIYYTILVQACLVVFLAFYHKDGTYVLDELVLKCVLTKPFMVITYIVAWIRDDFIMWELPFHADSFSDSGRCIPKPANIQEITNPEFSSMIP